MNAPNTMVAILAHPSGDIFDSTLSFTEDENLGTDFDWAHEFGKSSLIVFNEYSIVLSVFILIIHDLNSLLDPSVGGKISISYLDVNREDGAVVIGQFSYFLGPGRTPHERLAVWSYLSENFFQLNFEAHILYREFSLSPVCYLITYKHSVGLIQYQVRNPVEFECPWL